MYPFLTGKPLQTIAVCANEKCRIRIKFARQSVCKCSNNKIYIFRTEFFVVGQNYKFAFGAFATFTQKCDGMRYIIFVAGMTVGALGDKLECLPTTRAFTWLFIQFGRFYSLERADDKRCSNTFT